MAKKNFKTGIDGLIQSSLIEETTDKKKEFKSSVQIKATYYYHYEQLEKIKAISFYDRKPIGKVISEALEGYIKNYSNLDEAINIFSKSK